MFHWICPECGREIAPTVRECPACDPAAASAELVHAGVVEAPARTVNGASPAGKPDTPPESFQKLETPEHPVFVPALPEPPAVPRADSDSLSKFPSNKTISKSIPRPLATRGDAPPWAKPGNGNRLSTNGPLADRPPVKAPPPVDAPVVASTPEPSAPVADLDGKHPGDRHPGKPPGRPPWARTLFLKKPPASVPQPAVPEKLAEAPPLTDAIDRVPEPPPMADLKPENPQALSLGGTSVDKPGPEFTRLDTSSAEAGEAVAVPVTPPTVRSAAPASPVPPLEPEPILPTLDRSFGLSSLDSMMSAMGLLSDEPDSHAAAAARRPVEAPTAETPTPDLPTPEASGLHTSSVDVSTPARPVSSEPAQSETPPAEPLPTEKLTTEQLATEQIESAATESAPAEALTATAATLPTEAPAPPESAATVAESKPATSEAFGTTESAKPAEAPEPPLHGKVAFGARSVPPAVYSLVQTLRPPEDPRGAKPAVVEASNNRKEAAMPPVQLKVALPLPSARPAATPEPPPVLPVPNVAGKVVGPATPKPYLAPPLAGLVRYSPLAGRPLRAAVPRAVVLKDDAKHRITLPGPMLTPRLVKFSNRELKAVFPKALRQHKRVLPTWLLASMLGTGVVLLGYSGVFSSVPRSSADTRSDSPDALAANHSTGSNPLSRMVEVTGFRVMMDPAKKSEIQYLVVNHSPARFAEATVYVTLRAADAKPGQAPLCKFSFTAPDLGPYQSREMISMIEKLNRPISVPEWQDLRADVEIGQ